jgi:hypothetical protein
MKKSTRPGWLRRRALIGGAVMTAVAGFAVLGPTTAGASSPSVSVAVISPLLSTMETGTNVGLPLACGVATSVVELADSGAAAAIGKVGALCTVLATYGVEGMVTFNSDLAFLEVINPAADGLLSAFVNALNTFDAFESIIAPLGSDFAALGPDVAYLESQ